MANSWLFAADRGGTFTDLIGIDPKGRIHSRKLRSESPAYADAAIAGIRQLLQLADDEPIPPDQVTAIRIGTTVATNALLERKGEPTALLITKGFGDLLEIGNQSRPDIFALAIEKPEQLYQQVSEVNERLDASGEIILDLDEQPIIDQLQHWQKQGIGAIAVALMHSWINPIHELRIGELAVAAGFKQISLSHQCMRLIKLVNRAQTTLVDAYLSPILLRYVNQLQQELGDIPLEFMQSSGGLSDANSFTGKEAVLSGPAGGVVAVAQLADQHPEKQSQLIGFDMGGTSTDVCRYGGEFEYRHEVTTAGIAYHANMLQIETVAAGGGSILGFDGQRMTVGPESAGANPGPVCYGLGGPLTITDANLVLGRLLQVTFPRQFGSDHQSSIDAQASRRALEKRTDEINRATGGNLSVEQVALGYLQIANQQMAKPIRSVSVARGYDLRDHALVSFGGAGGLHAGELTTILGIDTLLIHPLAGIYSAWGIATAPRRHERERSLLLPFNPDLLNQLNSHFEQLADELKPLFDTGTATLQRRDLLDLRPQGSDSYLTVNRANHAISCAQFSDLFNRHYGYRIDTDDLELVNIRVEMSQASQIPRGTQPPSSAYPFAVPEQAEVYIDNCWQTLPCIALQSVRPNQSLPTPALVISDQFTLLIDAQFNAIGDESGGIILNRKSGQHLNKNQQQSTTGVDPITLEIYHHRFMGIAEQMGVTLQKTAHSVNMKERLDFSCALFDRQGNLVANAPHIPVHLGAMGATIKALISQGNLQPGEVYASNHPAFGGSHLPDVTVITPVFLRDDSNQPADFFVASRGHHADIGGTTPGSMAPFSTSLSVEGVLLNGLLLVKDGEFLEAAIRKQLTSGPYPARNIPERLADLRAQIAANQLGFREIKRLIAEQGADEVTRYMDYIQDNAAWAIDQAFKQMLSDQSELKLSRADQLDNGIAIAVTIHLKRANTDEPVSAEFDFTACGPQDLGSLNAPVAIVRAAVMYVLRTMLGSNIPLNEGCLRNVTIILPEHSVVNPDPDAAVVGGNVETSQRIVDVLLGALGLAAASQGTMNNLVFGWQTDNGSAQYYETLGGGSGATPTQPGASAVQVHMTNTRITDPEVLEQRFPGLRLTEYSIRRGSGGSGKQPGGDGLVREFEILEPVTATLLSQRRTTQPFGLNGGAAGMAGQNILKHDTEEQRLPGSGVIDLQPGVRLRIETPGGGGFGTL